jgi:hypothetical protein
MSHMSHKSHKMHASVLQVFPNRAPAIVAPNLLLSFRSGENLEECRLLGCYAVWLL